MTRVKICGLTNLADARCAWQAGADLLGFVLVPSSRRYVPPRAVAEIATALLAEGCAARLVGVWLNAPAELVRETTLHCGLHLAQLHGDESPQYVDGLGVPALVARRMRPELSWAHLAAYPAWGYLLDTDHPTSPGGTGQVWDWGSLPKDETPEAGARPPRWLIAGGLTAENVAACVRRAHPWGVDVSSGVEHAPGRKDPARIARFIHQVREVDRQ
jgi:phosphoribosylanthranilate isomerase